MNTKFIKSITAGGVTFRYSVGRSLARGKELHPHHEILYYLGGDAEFLSTEYHLRPQCGSANPNHVAFLAKYGNDTWRDQR